MIEQFLKYQGLDSELLKLEKELDNNENKKQANLMIKFVKDATERTKQLNEEAGVLIKELEKLQEIESKGVALVVKLSKQEVSGLDEAELKEMELKISNASKNLKELEKRLLTQSEKVKNILAEFENTKKKVFIARQKHKEHKEQYDAQLKDAEPKLQEVKKELKQLESSLMKDNKEVFEKYRELRKDGVFPIFVPLNDKSCGGCRTNLPSTTLEKLKNDTTIRCENCRRIIYTK